MGEIRLLGKRLLEDFLTPISSLELYKNSYLWTY